MAHDKYGLPSICVSAPVPKQIRHRARALRKQPTPAEAAAWELLRNRRCLGLKFRRQQAIGSFVVDFYCAELRTALELDGGVHDDPGQREYDRLRDAALARLGVTILRVRNEDVSLEYLRRLLRS